MSCAAFPTIIYGILNGQIVPIGTLTITPNGQIVLTPSAGSVPVAHLDSEGNIQILDTTNNQWKTLTAPNGILTLSQ